MDIQDYETKGERREKKRFKGKTSQIGTPWTKIRLTNEAELRAKVSKIKMARKKKDQNQNND